MLLWIVLAAMTALALGAVLWPLVGTRSAVGSVESHDLAVYRDQLREIEADLERGAILGPEAEAARAEIGRRVLASAARGEAGPKGAANKSATDPGIERHPLLVYGAMFATAVLAIVSYLVVGSPGLPDQPLAARLAAPASEQGIELLVARVEEHLRKAPGDGEGWAVVAPIYMRLGRYDDAVDAFAKALRLKGDELKLLEGFGEASVLASDGIVGEAARRAFEAIRQKAPDRMSARFWLAVAAEQDGLIDDAKAAYQAMLADGPADAPWRSIVEQRLAAVSGGAPVAGASGEDVAGRTAGSGESASAGGPSAADVAAAGSMTDAERQQMIEGMVGRLAERLKTDGRDADGWQKLVRAYSVLGRRDDALKALADGRAALADDTEGLTALEGLARDLGLGS